MKAAWNSHLLEHLENSLNHAEKSESELVKEAGSTVTWIVGLASAGVALLAANDAVMGILSTRVRIAAIACMLLSIALGVTHRVVVLQYGSVTRAQIFQLRSYLISKLKGMGGHDIPEADETWSIEQAAENIQLHFGMPSSYLVSKGVPATTAIELYKALRRMEYEYFSMTVQDVLEETAKYGGRKAADTRTSDEDTHARARQMIRLFNAAVATFALSGLAFVVGLLLVAMASF